MERRTPLSALGRRLGKTKPPLPAERRFGVFGTGVTEAQSSLPIAPVERLTDGLLRGLLLTEHFRLLLPVALGAFSLAGFLLRFLLPLLLAPLLLPALGLLVLTFPALKPLLPFVVECLFQLLFTFVACDLARRFLSLKSRRIAVPPGVLDDFLVRRSVRTPRGMRVLSAGAIRRERSRDESDEENVPCHCGC